MYARNLVPCCRDCNNLRGATFDSKTGERRILHFFDDEVSSLPPVLRANLGLKNSVPIISYEVAPTTHPLGAVYQCHFHALGLVDRFRTRARSRLLTLRDRVQQERPSVTTLLRVLRHERKAIERSRGGNDWEVALLEALEKAPAVLDWLRK